jgi:flagellar basal-body rod protein FlgB
LPTRRPAAPRKPLLLGLFWLWHRHCFIQAGNVCMIDALFSQTNYLVAKKMLDGTVLRQEAIAANLENLETPGYKRLDLAPSFSAELQRAASSNNPSQMAGLRPGLAVDANATPVRPDGNTIQLEQELLTLNQNSLEHALETQLITGSLLKLRLAITGRTA